MAHSEEKQPGRTVFPNGAQDLRSGDGVAARPGGAPWVADSRRRAAAFRPTPPWSRRGERSMRIGIVCYPTYGGSGVVATELGRMLARRG
ncbi:MAG: hypothetical protein NTW86_19830, partial [Candidatus Sumerlaeota bacterium]|nr:hypothetical protein [Candidatus Sumerlaeota bacterium]